MSSAAERQRRSRAHRKGDHSLCDPARCDGSGVVTAEGSVTTPVPSHVTELQVAAPTDPDAEPGEIEIEVRTFVAGLKFADGDPRRVLGSIAVQLGRRVDQTGAAPAAIRELRVLLAQISELPEAEAGPVDGTRARRAARRIGTILTAVN